MFIVSIKINAEKIPQQQMQALLEKHREWFTKYFNNGAFLVAGPYKDIPYAGVIIAKCADRAALDNILKQDVYYNDKLAVYEVHEFAAGLATSDVSAWKE